MNIIKNMDHLKTICKKKKKKNMDHMKTICKKKKKKNMDHVKTINKMVNSRKEAWCSRGRPCVCCKPKPFNHSSVFKQKLILISLDGIYCGGDVEGLRPLVDKIIQ